MVVQVGVVMLAVGYRSFVVFGCELLGCFWAGHIRTRTPIVDNRHVHIDGLSRIASDTSELITLGLSMMS